MLYEGAINWFEEVYTFIIAPYFFFYETLLAALYLDTCKKKKKKSHFFSFASSSSLYITFKNRKVLFEEMLFYIKKFLTFKTYSLFPSKLCHLNVCLNYYQTTCKLCKLVDKLNDIPAKK